MVCPRSCILLCFSLFVLALNSGLEYIEILSAGPRTLIDELKNCPKDDSLNIDMPRLKVEIKDLQQKMEKDLPFKNIKVIYRGFKTITAGHKPFSDGLQYNCGWSPTHLDQFNNTVISTIHKLLHISTASFEPISYLWCCGNIYQQLHFKCCLHIQIANLCDSVKKRFNNHIVFLGYRKNIWSCSKKSSEKCHC